MPQAKQDADDRLFGCSRHRDAKQNKMFQAYRKLLNKLKSQAQKKLKEFIF
jgi:hypothetical protein